jgi:hypothetical protein
VLGVELEDPLAGRDVLAGGLEDALHVAAEAAVVVDEARGALAQALAGPHVLDLAGQELARLAEDRGDRGVVAGLVVLVLRGCRGRPG